MNVHGESFSDFLLHFEYVNLHALQQEFPFEVQQSPMVVVAHILDVVSSFGVDLIVEDHTGSALLALRGDTAFDFYEEHMRSPHHPGPDSASYRMAKAHAVPSGEYFQPHGSPCESWRFKGF